VHTDDTGWRVGGEPAHLMVFETAAATVYQVRARHRNEEVRTVVSAEYEGVLVTDRGRSYDAIELAGVRQQKCLAHIQRTLSEVLARQHGKVRASGSQLKGLFRHAIDLWHAYHQGKRSGFAAQAQQLQHVITHHLRDRPLKDPDNRRLLNELGWHHDRGNLLRFLDDPRVEPTNNRAERALRPAVIARKVSQCSKNARGRRRLRRSPAWCARWPRLELSPSSKDCCTFSTLPKCLILPPKPATKTANQLRHRVFLF
jgi:transposase